MGSKADVVEGSGEGSCDTGCSRSLYEAETRREVSIATKERVEREAAKMKRGRTFLLMGER